MATWSTGISLRGSVGAQIIVASAPPGATLGNVGDYAIVYPAAGVSSVTTLYGPKSASGWPQTAGSSGGSSSPLGYVLTGSSGAAGAPGAAGANGRTIFQVSGTPSTSLGQQAGDLALDPSNAFLYTYSGTAWSSPPISLVGPSGPKGDVGAAAILPNDYTGNSFTVAPVSGDATASGLTQKNASGNTLFASDSSGNVTVGGTLKTVGATTLAAASCTSMSNSGNATVAGTMAVSGATTLAAVTQSSSSTTSNASVGGTLSVTGASTQAAISATSLATSAGATVGTTLGVSGATTLAAASCTTLSTSSNATVAGTLAVTGATTLAAVTASSSSTTSNASVGGTLSVTGATSVAAVTSTGLVTAPNVTLTSGGGGKLTFADGTTQTTAGSSSAKNSRSFFDMGGYYTTSGTSGTFLTTQKAVGSVAAATVDVGFKVPFPCQITGWAVQQYASNAGVTTLQYYKNMASFGASFAVNSNNTTGRFGGTHAAGVYTYAAGDVIQVTHAWGSGSSSNMQCVIFVEWL